MNKIIAKTLMLVLVLSSCAPPRYLDKVKESHLSQYGGYITLFNNDGIKMTGELIAVSAEKMVLYSLEVGECYEVPTSSVRRYEIIFAAPEKYGWAIPTSAALTLSHGFFAILTMPINLLTTTIVSISANQSTRLTHNDLTLNELKMYARFPQGIPEGVELDEIKQFSE